MPIQSLKLRPGVDTQKPPLANEGGWSTANLIRFMDGCPQAIGGWMRWTTQQLDSPARTILSWSDLNGNVYTASGTDTQVYVTTGNATSDITPLTTTTNPPVDFSTTSGSSAVEIRDSLVGTVSGTSINLVTPISVGGIVLEGTYAIASIISADSYTITASSNATSTVGSGGAVPSFTTAVGSPNVQVMLDNHGLTVGQSFGVALAVAVGGVTLQGSYLVQSIIDVDNFTITAATSATSVATALLNGGDAQITYYGVAAISGVNYGYGIGGYGEGGYGQGSQYAPGLLPTVPLWTLGTWGETLIIGQGQGGLYTWTPGTGQTQASLILEAPPVVNGAFIAMPELTVVAWGTSVDGVQQPLLLSWCTAGDYTVWNPTVTNQAGSYQIPSGSRVVAGMQAPQQALIWTDQDLYSMNYLGANGGTELAWGFIKVADHCGLVGPRAMCVLNEFVFWLSASAAEKASGLYPSGGQFLMFGGGEVVPIPCTVWDKLFQDLDWANSTKIVAASNSLFGEVAWYYPSLSGGTGENDSYVKFNTVERVWDYGKLPITGWQDYSPAGNPLAGHADAYLYQHEIGYTDNGQPMNWSIGSSAIMIAEGNDMMFVDWLLPEFQWGMQDNPGTNQPVTVTANAFDFANDAPLNSNSVTFSQSGLGYSALRLRGRHIEFQFSGPGFARIGNVRFRAAPDGRY